MLILYVQWNLFGFNQPIVFLRSSTSFCPTAAARWSSKWKDKQLVWEKFIKKHWLRIGCKSECTPDKIKQNEKKYHPVVWRYKKKHLKQAKNKIKNYEKSDSNASCNTIQMIIPLPEEESSLWLYGITLHVIQTFQKVQLPLSN